MGVACSARLFSMLSHCVPRQSRRTSNGPLPRRGALTFGSLLRPGCCIVTHGLLLGPAFCPCFGLATAYTRDEVKCSILDQARAASTTYNAKKVSALAEVGLLACSRSTDLARGFICQAPTIWTRAFGITGPFLMSERESFHAVRYKPKASLQSLACSRTIDSEHMLHSADGSFR